MLAEEILEKYGSLEAYYAAIKEAQAARREELINMLDSDSYRFEALTSLGKAEASDLDTKEAKYYVALAQVFATLELVETLRSKD
jgi:hypothetical protein